LICGTMGEVPTNGIPMLKSIFGLCNLGLIRTYL